ncbi:LytTR family transcriptional regulator DNA-binding domain-containing protein [Chryseomicrobium sp. FSL W7-1435]|uniref:LytTR family transcriptional regulator DNA-binding domain-containing protein n=1 Tax=Chryseomicrobium sp. FSL W7-1435 TaxID=2921704 RepID=UPI00315A79AE
MTLTSTTVMEKERVWIPGHTFTHGTTGLLVDMKRAASLMNQFQRVAYVHQVQDGHHPHLTVQETINYYLKLSDTDWAISELLKLFDLTAEARMKVKKLSETKRNTLSFIRAFCASGDWVVIEEPFHRIELEGRYAVEQILRGMQRQGKSILLLSTNLEDLLPVSDSIYRLDERGIHKMEFKDDTAPLNEEPTQLKVNKIQVKHREKTLLFNPPEVDYIESIDGTVYINVAGIAYTSSFTLTELEARLQHYGFYRCHRSYIVNLQKVRELVSWTKNSYSIKLDVEKTTLVPISRAKLSLLKELLGIS